MVWIYLAESEESPSLSESGCDQSHIVKSNPTLKGCSSPECRKDEFQELPGKQLPEVEIIYGGFPCQDISVAGKGKGLEGERSGLFFQIMRLVSEIRPPFLFLENVPAITTRGLGTVTSEITKAGYDCRWTTRSAAEVGANHRRERWWLLAYSNSGNRGALSGSSIRSEVEENEGSGSGPLCKNIPNADRDRLNESNLHLRSGQQAKAKIESFGGSSNVPHSDSNGIREQSRRRRGESWGDTTKFVDDSKILNTHNTGLEGQREESGRACEEFDNTLRSGWWATEPNVGRVAHGVPFRVDRIKGLGNAVVPLCAKEAFKELMGIK